MTKFIGTPLRGIEFANPGDEAISSRVSGDTQPRLRIDAGGRITWSDGTNSGDTVLFRSDANALTTYDSLTASAGLITLTTSGAPTQSLPNGAIAIDTTNNVFYFRSNSQWLEVSGGATVTVSDSAPTPADIGDLWYNSSELELYIYYSTWIQLTHTPEFPTVEELDNVYAENLAAGDVLTYDGSDWYNEPITQLLVESVTDASTSGGLVTLDYTTGNNLYIPSSPSANFTLNLTNAPTENGKAITIGLFVTQGGTGFIPNVVQVAGVAQTIKWTNSTAPTPSQNKIDIFSFTFVRRSSTWTVFGSAELGY